MISGQQAFGGMSATLARERASLDDLEMQLRSLQSQTEDLHSQDLEDIRALAGLHLDDVIAGEVVGRLSRAEAEAKGLLAERGRAQGALDQQILDANARLSELHTERDDAQGAIEASEMAIEAAEKKTHDRLQNDASYTAQEEAARQADVKAANARQKADQSASELSEKGQADKDSALFNYLWDRKYGLPAYSAFPLFRYLDGKVARLIGYTDARLNFTRLTELPERLLEHAQSLAKMSEEEGEKLQSLWEDARREDGITALDTDLENAESAAQTINEHIENAQISLEDLQAQRHGVTDAATRKAVDVLTKALRAKDIEELWGDARETLRREDDVIVKRLFAREDERDRLEDLQNNIKRNFDRRHNRLEDFGGMLGKFRKKYTKSNSGFLDGAVIGILVKEFLEGLLDADDWWDEIEDQFEYRRPKRSSPSGPWGGKKRSRSSWPSKKPKFGRRSGGGGFRTGGGFRSSGGFRTGGGI